MEPILDKLRDMFIRITQFTPTTWTLLILLVLIALGGILFIKKSRKVTITPRMLVYASICIALAFVLSYIRLVRMPQSGSITPGSMLPMFLFAYIFGPIPGVMAGLAYGLLQSVQDPFIVHWAQYLLDYPLAFGLLGLAGLYRKNLAIAIFIGAFGRFFMHFLSGIIFFGEFAPEGTPVVLYSLVYNGSFLGADALICILLAQVPQIRNMAAHVKSTYGRIR